MEKLVKLGLNSEGKPRRVPAQELANRLVGHGWMYPWKLKQEYDISDELWPKVQSAIAKEYRDAFRKSRNNNQDLIYAEMNMMLSPYALALPHGATMENVNAIRAFLTGGQSQDLADYIFKIVMAPIYRARLFVKRYSMIAIFEEFAYLIESSYFAFLRDNFAASFMTILPVIEGVIQRWANKPQQLQFPEMWEFVRKTPMRNPLLSVPLFADVWANTCASIMENHLYKNTKNGSSFDDFNRHLALHMIKRKDFCTPHNIARSFLLLDSLGDLYLAEHNKHDVIDTNPGDVVMPYLSPYLSIITNRTNCISYCKRITTE